MCSKRSPRISSMYGRSRKSSRESKSSPGFQPATAMATALSKSRPCSAWWTGVSPTWPKSSRNTNNPGFPLGGLAGCRSQVGGPVLQPDPGPFHLDAQQVNLSIEPRRRKRDAVFMPQQVGNLPVRRGEILPVLQEVDASPGRLAQLAERTVAFAKPCLQLGPIGLFLLGQLPLFGGLADLSRERHRQNPYIVRLQPGQQSRPVHIGRSVHAR